MDLSGLEWVLEQICAETCWALPAHVNRKKDESGRFIGSFCVRDCTVTSGNCVSTSKRSAAGVTVSDLEGKQQESVAAVSYTGKRCILVGNE